MLADLLGKLPFDLGELIGRADKKASAQTKKLLKPSPLVEDPPVAKIPIEAPAGATAVELPPDSTSPGPADQDAIDRVTELRRKELPKLLKRAEAAGLGAAEKDLQGALTIARELKLDGELIEQIPVLLKSISGLQRDIQLLWGIC